MTVGEGGRKRRSGYRNRKPFLSLSLDSQAGGDMRTPLYSLAGAAFLALVSPLAAYRILLIVS
jgi:hypothetical protein